MVGWIQMDAEENGEDAPKVFIVMDNGKYDLTPALKYGNPVRLFVHSIYPDSVNSRVPRIMTYLRQVLEKFNPDEDHLLLIGDPSLIAMTMGTLIMMGKTRIKMLKFDRRNVGYYEIEVDFAEGLNII